MYIVYHGWAFAEKVAEFKTKKKALEYIMKQDNPEEYCYEKED